MNRFSKTSVAVLSVASISVAVISDDPVYAPYDDAMSVSTTTMGSTDVQRVDFAQDTITGEEIAVTPAPQDYETVSPKSS